MMEDLTDNISYLNFADNPGTIDVESDFIVLGEFSEKDGPVPREIIGPCSPKFPLDNFVLRLMSVELQLDVGEKWSVWIDWTSQRVESLVVHFQLQDINARGYCRPLALAYVTYDPKKLVKYRDDYLLLLNKVTDMMLAANSKLFITDVEQRLQDLCLVGKIQELLSAEEGSLNEPELRLVERIRNEVKDHRIFVPKKDTFEEILQDMNAIYSRMEKHNNLQDLLEEKAQGCHEYLLDNIDNLPLIPELNRVRELQFKNSLYDKHLRTLDELIPLVYADTTKLLSNGLDVLKHDQIVLEHISSEKRQCFSPPSALLSIGNVAMLNFNLDPQTTYSHMTSQAPIDFSEVWLKNEPDNGNLYVGGSDFEDLEVESISTILWPSFSGSLPSCLLSREDSSSSVGSQKVFSETSDSDINDMGVDPIIQDTGEVKERIRSTRQRSHPKKKGYSLLDLRNISFNRHLLYTLLKGRTLVILAEARHKNAVINTIETLKIFVCGYHLVGEKKVVPWKDETSLQPGQKHIIDLQSLSTCKLVGIDKTCSIPRNVERHISIWD